MKSQHIKLGKVCRRLKDAKILAKEWTRSIQDQFWARATEQLLIALMKKLQHERGKKWDMPDLRLLTQAPREDLVQLLCLYRPKYACLLVGDVKKADALMINLQIALSGLIA